MFDPSVPKRLTSKKIATIFNQKMYESLVWRMQQAERFSNHIEGPDIRGADLRLWDIVIGRRCAEYANSPNVDTESFEIVIGIESTEDHAYDHVCLMTLDEAFESEHTTSIGGKGTAYFRTNNTFRTIEVSELPAFWAALEACYA